MTINISVPRDESEIKPRITVVGVGGAGGNAVNNMIRSNLEGVEFVVTNTDSQALTQSLADRRLQLGASVTQGLGAGSRPDIGKAAAEEAMEQLITELGDSNMVFITAGMGGGTGTGAAPVIAQAARERGILTVGVITKPFHFEGAHRMRTAEQGIGDLSQFVDTLIIIPNQNLFRIANEKTTFADAFHLADNVLHQGVRGVTDLMVMPGLINLDFADIRAVMSEMGKAMMGTGEASGEKRAIEASESAISNPLLDDMSMKGARGVLINITGGMDMTLFEVDEAANRIREEVDAEANIIFGSTFDEKLDGLMRVSVVATGIAAEGLATKPRPPMTVVSNRPNPVLDLEEELEPKREVTAQEPNFVPKAKSELGSALKNDVDYASITSGGILSPDGEADGKLAIGAEVVTQISPPAEMADVTKSEVDPTSHSVSEVNTIPIISRPAEDAFVAPPPAVPPRQSVVQKSSSVDPFNAAALANAGGTPTRAPSLFQRVTGMARKQREEPLPKAEPAPAERDTPGCVIQPSGGAEYRSAPTGIEAAGHACEAADALTHARPNEACLPS